MEAQIKLEVEHIFLSGVNEARIIDLITRLLKQREKEVRHAAAEIALTESDPSDAHQKIMNIHF